MVATLRYRNWSAALLVVLSSVVLMMTADAMAMNVTVDYDLFRCMSGFFLGYLTYQVYQTLSDRLRSDLPAAGAMEAACVLLVIWFVTAAGIGTLSFLAPLVFSLTVLVFAVGSG